MPTTHIAIFTEIPHLQPKAEAIAQRLKLPYTDLANQADYDYLLILTADSLGLQKTGGKSLPLVIDFLSGKIAYRRQHTSLRRETLARAMGLKTNKKPKILDATAGLARDSFILACLGFEVDMLERSPIIHLLIEDGIERALQDTEVAEIVQRLHLIQGDAVSWMETLSTSHKRPDIIYLDPMFPERSKSALTKKDMRIFHEVVGDDPDADRLLITALTCATQRVVVKRPRLAAHLAGLSPAFSLPGSSSRFDVYLIQAAHGTTT